MLLVGSATPRPESWTALRRIELPERVDNRSLPPVELLDMRGLRHALHPDSRAALDEVGRRGAKAIVLVNRRGWAPFVLCRSCGHGWTCPRCDVTLTLHRAGRPRIAAVPPLRTRRAGARDLRASADRRRWRGKAPAPSGSRPSLRRRSRRCRCSASTATRPGAKAASRTCSTASDGLPRACWSERRWSRRGMTSRRWSWPSSRTPTGPCGSPTSAPRSAPSPSSRSWPAAVAAGRPAAACSSRRCARTRAPSSTPPATTPRASSRRRSSAAACCATRPSRR